jgi:hypothetical protein
MPPQRADTEMRADSTDDQSSGARISKGSNSMSNYTTTANGKQPHANSNSHASRNHSNAGAPPAPPYNLEAEQSTIGAMLMELQAAETALEILTVGDFYHQTHRIIFSCIAAMHRRGDETDFITVGEELRRHDQLGDGERQVSAAYLQACWEACPAASTVKAHAKIVRELSQKRRAAILAHKAHSHAMNGVGPSVALTDIRRSLEALEGEIKATASPSGFELFSLRDMAAMPRPLWLVRGILIEKISSVISADTGCFKSFFALDMALSVALGRPFMGREVKKGTAVYVAAEGFFTIAERAAAFAQHHDCELPENFHALKVPINLGNAGTVEAFADAIEELAPALVVLDTLSQCAVGANENDNGQMANFIRGMMALCERIGAHVTVLHHNGKNTGTFRGAGAIKANADAHITLDRPEGDDQNTVFVRNEKQRGKLFKSFALRGVEIVLPFTDEYGDAVTSLVFEPCDDEVAPKVEKHPNAKKADKTSTALLEAFDEVAREAAELGIDGVKTGFWKAKVEEAEPPICPPSTFWRHRKALLKSGVIDEVGTHNGSPLLKRVNPTLKTLKTLSESNESEPAKDSREQLSQLSHSFRSESCESNEGAGANAVSAAADKKPRKTKRRAQNNADSEPYAAPVGGDDEVMKNGPTATL